MPAINFKKKFVPDIESGVKHQTIRQIKSGRKSRFKVGGILFLFSGQRTKYCRRIGTAVVKSVQKILIQRYISLIKSSEINCVYVDNYCLDTEEILSLAKADGFKDSTEFFYFFFSNYGDEFEGELIIWKDFKPHV